MEIFEIKEINFQELYKLENYPGMEARKLVARLMKLQNEFIIKNNKIPNLIIDYRTYSMLLEVPSFFSLTHQNNKETQRIGNLMGIEIFMCNDYYLLIKNPDVSNVIYTTFDPDETIKKAFIVNKRREKLNGLNI